MKIMCRPKRYSKNEIEIFCDDELWKIVHTSIFTKKPSIPTECFSKEELQETFNFLEKQGTKNYALKLLSKKMQTTNDIKRKLTEKLVSQSTINIIIEDLKQFGYIDDDYWIKSFIEKKISQKQGPQIIAYKLTSKGLSIEEAKNIVEAYYTEDKQIEIIKNLIATKYKLLNPKNLKEKQKILNSLQRKGFDGKMTISCLE